MEINGRIKFKNQTSNPGSPAEGDVYYNSTDKKLKVYDGSNFGNVGSGLSQIATATTSGNATSVTFSSLSNLRMVVIYGGFRKSAVGDLRVTINGLSTLYNMGVIKRSSTSSVTGLEGRNKAYWALTGDESSAQYYSHSLNMMITAAKATTGIDPTASIWSQLTSHDGTDIIYYQSAGFIESDAISNITSVTISLSAGYFTNNSYFVLLGV